MVSIKSFTSFVLICAVTTALVLTTPGNSQALELCAKADRRGDPTQPKDKSKITMRTECRAGKEISLGTTADLAAVVDLFALVHQALAHTLPCAVQVENDVYFEGCNVHVRSGSGTTAGFIIPPTSTSPGDIPTVNGLGNLIIGYNEFSGGPAGFLLGTEDRTGSHNLVVGPEHSYSSYGGLVAGVNNRVGDKADELLLGFPLLLGPYSTVTGGRDNHASGLAASVSGGRDNAATNESSSVSGGFQNLATGDRSAVGGGWNNAATGSRTTVSGGAHRTAADTTVW